MLGRGVRDNGGQASWRQVHEPDGPFRVGVRRQEEADSPGAISGPARNGGIVGVAGRADRAVLRGGQALRFIEQQESQIKLDFLSPYLPELNPI